MSPSCFESEVTEACLSVCLRASMCESTTVLTPHSARFPSSESDALCHGNFSNPLVWRDAATGCGVLPWKNNHHIYTLGENNYHKLLKFEGPIFSQRRAWVPCGCDKTNRPFGRSVWCWWSSEQVALFFFFFFLYLQKTSWFFNEVPTVLNEDSMRHRMGPLQRSPASFFWSLPRSRSSQCFWTSRSPHLSGD